MPEGSEVADARSPLPDRLAETHEVLQAIAGLPEDFRLAIVAIDIVGLSYGEAAKTLGTREATITSRLYRARQRLASQFGDDLNTPSGSTLHLAREGSVPNGVSSGVRHNDRQAHRR